MHQKMAPVALELELWSPIPAYESNLQNQQVLVTLKCLLTTDSQILIGEKNRKG